jgi:chemotaxis protein MotB
MSAPGGKDPQELVIVRRRGTGDEAGGKGGVWKIAYADFMTAMMAFFLVMWLINAANEETRAQVASYFNPIKLTDSTSSERGLSQPKSKENKDSKDTKSAELPAEEANEKGKGSKPAENAHDEKKEDAGKPAGDSEERRFSEDELFKDPYVVLAQLAGQAAAGSPAGESNNGMANDKTGQSGLKSGEAFRDPFDPLAWKNLPEPPSEPVTAEKSEAVPPQKQTEAAAQPSIGSDLSAHPLSVPGTDEGQAHTPEAVQAKTEAEELAEVSPPHVEASQSSVQELKPSAVPAKEPKPSIDQAEAVKVKAEIMKELGEAQSTGAPAIDIVATEDGVLISLTDTLDFGMFAIASAEPKPELVVTMEKIAKVLREKDGRIVIRGHTDGRPYKDENYDNWRLSTARAHMAYYMLVRAGVDESKIDRIEGYADKNLKTPADPLAAQNRRIEIMLRAAGE